MKAWLAIPLVSLALVAASVQAVELPRMFSDGMVLQRDQPIPIWGRAQAGARVRVVFAGSSAETTAGANGAWRVELPAHVAGGPYELSIVENGKPQVLRDVLVGEVWLASGQSNMEFELEKSANAQATIAAAHDPLIRHFKIPRSWAGSPQWQLQGGSWVAANPADAGKFSAVAYFFARQLRDRLGVPVGIIDSTWGGSTIEAWTDAATQGADPEAMAGRERELRQADEAVLAQTRAHLGRWSLPADDAGWQAADVDESSWASITVPSIWETVGYAGVDGVAWYRARFTLDAAQVRAGVTLGVGRIDDSDTTWINGVQVGRTHMQYNTPRTYTVPAAALHAGVNHVAVRVEDYGGGGGVHGAPAELFVQPADGARIALQGWVFRPAQATVSLVDNKNQVPTLLYNAMIHPLQPYPIAGVIWYQGESNADTVEQARRYRQQFPAMIRQWRRQWNAPGLPFLWVQLANFGSGLDHGQESPWAVLRESQSATLALPGTAQAVTIDIGNLVDIHPTNKRDVGLRLALAARHVAYGDSLVFRGPVFTGMRIEHGVATLSFDTGNSALAVRGGGKAVQGFQLAGSDHVFHPALATIEGDTVLVQSDVVPTPGAVRYGWHDNPEDANLANTQGLPASPFRSEAW